MNGELKLNDIAETLLILDKRTVDALYKTDDAMGCVPLYIFYYKTAKWQKTNRVKANDVYVKKCLNIGTDRLRKLKNMLKEVGLIQIIQSRKNGKINGWYIEVSYLVSQSKMDISVDSKNTSNQQVVDSTSSIEETNALKKQIKCLKKEIEVLKKRGAIQDLNNSREEKKSNTLPIESNSGVSDDDSQTNNFSCQSIEETNICKGVEQKEKTTKEMPRPELPTDKLTREHFWIYRADYDVLKADYSQNDIDLYIQKYNNQVTKSGKAYPSPVGTIREWMLSDKIPKKKVYDPEWDKIMFQANFPRFEWETDEGYEERMKRFVKAGLHHHHDGNIRKWLNDDAVEIARQITSEVRGEYGYQ